MQITISSESGLGWLHICLTRRQWDAHGNRSFQERLLFAVEPISLSGGPEKP